MTCLECGEQIQQLLDGESAPHELEVHLARCKMCHELHVLSRSLLRGLAQTAPPTPREGFSDAVVRAVLRDRGSRRIRRRLFAAAAAAALLFGAFGVFRLNTGAPEPSRQFVVLPETPQPSLQDNVQQAGQAIADLTVRAAADRLQTSRSFLPPVDFNTPADSPATLADMPTEPRRAWNDAVGGVSVGLEPLAMSARQAASFFRREMPLFDSEAGNAIK